MSHPGSEPQDNEMAHPSPHLQPKAKTQPQTQNKDDHAERKSKAHALTKGSLICHRSNVKLYL